MRKREEEHKHRHDEEGARAKEEAEKAAREAKIAAELDAQAAKVAMVVKTPATLTAAAVKMKISFEEADVEGMLGGSFSQSVSESGKIIIVDPDQVLDATELRFRLDMDEVQTVLRDCNMLRHFDKGGNGTVELDELVAVMDSNEDGSVSMGECMNAIINALENLRKVNAVRAQNDAEIAAIHHGHATEAATIVSEEEDLRKVNATRAQNEAEVVAVRTAHATEAADDGPLPEKKQKVPRPDSVHAPGFVLPEDPLSLPVASSNTPAPSRSPPPPPPPPPPPVEEVHESTPPVTPPPPPVVLTENQLRMKRIDEQVAIAEEKANLEEKERQRLERIDRGETSHDALEELKAQEVDIDRIMKERRIKAQAEEGAKRERQMAARKLRQETEAAAKIEAARAAREAKIRADWETEESARKAQEDAERAHRMMMIGMTPGQRRMYEEKKEQEDREREFQAREKLFTVGDTDGDGMLSLAEAMAQGMDEATFAAIDADGNGQLTKDEFEAWQGERRASQVWPSFAPDETYD